MVNQKAENLLNLALDATEQEREKSMELEVGYDKEERSWDLIIKYSGDLDAVRGLGADVTELLNEYAIVNIPEYAINAMSALPEVEYIEKPKSLFFQVENGRRASCVTPLQRSETGLFGNGVLVAIIDSGIDYANQAFRNPDGTSRILELWDQGIPGNPPPGYSIGTLYTKETIDEAFRQPTQREQYEIVPSRDSSGHGTAVAGIAAGNGAGSIAARYAGVASRSQLLVVKLGVAQTGGFPRTTELMLALDYVIRRALAFRLPVSVNISFGNTYGSHDGTSLVERFIDDISNYWKSVICVGSGNEAASAGHTGGRLRPGIEQIVELAVGANEPSLNLQIWKAYVDEVDISIISPSGERVGPIQEILGPQRFTLGKTELLLYYGEPSPYSVQQEIYLDFVPTTDYINGGIWRIQLVPRRVVTGEYQMWLPSQSVLNASTGFLLPSDTATLTIPSTAENAITVGAYDSLTNTYADFSGRGFATLEQGVRSNILRKPDLVAPGVNVITTAVGGGYQPVSGTSFATPFVCGGAALLMEWGIVRGNDPYLYDADIIGLS
ncbi:MAG: S8 family serine peptidase [Hespellia sp.]|nr:S8 family serine peptidase [Hespellia sp.]